MQAHFYSLPLHTETSKQTKNYEKCHNNSQGIVSSLPDSDKKVTNCGIPPKL